MAASLQDLCGVQVAIVLANHPDLKKEIFNGKAENYDFTKYESTLVEYDKSVQDKLKKILEDIPYRLRQIIPLNLIPLIGIKMIEWAKYHKKEFGFSFGFSKNFLKSSLFTTKGTIDKEKAARILVRKSGLSLYLRYKIACSYFLIDVVPSLFKEIPEKGRLQYKLKAPETYNPQDEMLQFWYHYMTGKVKSLLRKGIRETPDNVLTYAYAIAVGSRNEVAVLNIWKKMNTPARNSVARKVVDKISLRLFGSFVHNAGFFTFCEPYFDMLGLLFINSDRVIRKRLLSNNEMCFPILKCFLNWPYQDLFIDAVELVLENLPKKKYYFLLHEIVDRFESKFSDTFDYRFLLKELWNQGPQEYKRYVLGVREADEQTNAADDDDYDAYEKSHNYGFLISKIFELKTFNFEDIENVRLILGSSLPEEKVKIMDKQGKNVCHTLVSSGQFSLADLFIECCLEEDKISEFKKSLISTSYGGFIFRKIMFGGDFNLADKILDWALKQEEIVEFKQTILSLIPVKPVIQYFRREGRHSSIACIDNFIKWAAPSCNIEDYKKEYLLQSDFTDSYRYSIFSAEPLEIQHFLRWFFASEKALKTFKKEFAFKLIRNVKECFDIKKGLLFVEIFVNWCEFSKQERQAFTKRFAYTEFVLKRCSEFAINHDLEKIDEFIKWCDLPKDDVRDLKRHLVFNNSRIHTLYSDLVIKGKQEIVENFIKWSELSEDHAERFKKQLALSQDELLHEYKNLIVNGKLKDIEEILKRFPLTEEELKGIRRKIIVQNLSALENLILENQWSRVEGLMKWCFTSAEEITRFKRENFLNRNSNGYNIYFLLTIRGRYDESKTYLNWLKVYGAQKKSDFIRQVMFNVKVFQSVAKLLVEDGENVIKDNLKWFLADNEAVNRFRRAFLMWFAEQAVRNYCLNCGERSLDTEHTYNLERVPVFCYNVMRRTAKSEHLAKFNILIDEYLNKPVLEKENETGSGSATTTKTGSSSGTSSQNKSETDSVSVTASGSGTGTEKRTRTTSRKRISSTSKSESTAVKRTKQKGRPSKKKKV
ncbi:UNVERIFIED_CONTAM: hypothetical protein RMT77_016052 [Armadillidium vulgare]